MLHNSKRAKEYLARYDLEAVIVSAPISVSYLSGLDCWMYTDFRENMLTPGGSNAMTQSYGIITPDNPATVIVSTGTVNFIEGQDIEIRTYGDAAAKLPRRRGGEPAAWSKYRKVIGTARETPQEALVSALQELGVKKGRVGVEFHNLSKAARKHLASKMDRVDLLDATELFKLIRMVKTEGEHKIIKKAAEITEEGMFKSFAQAADGVAFGRMSAVYLAEVARHGAVPDHYTFSPAGFGIARAEDYVFRNGDATQIDCGVHYKLYSSDTGVGLVFGRGRKDAEKMYGTLWEIFDSCVDTLTPGATPSHILKRFKKAYKKRGIEGVSYQGHSIGLQAREYPIIAYSKYKRITDDIVDLSTDIPLEEGMVINIETGLNIYGDSSYQVERTFRIGKRNAREITPKRDSAPFIVTG